MSLAFPTTLILIAERFPFDRCNRSKMKRPMKWTEHKMQITFSENMQKVSLFYCQNNKIVWLSNMADTYFGGIQEVRKGMCFFSWLCFSDVHSLGRQTPITWLWTDQAFLKLLTTCFSQWRFFKKCDKMEGEFECLGVRVCCVVAYEWPLIEHQEQSLAYRNKPWLSLSVLVVSRTRMDCARCSPKK